MWGMPEGLIRMSLIGSYCILLILPVRLLLSGCGRKYACCLWAAVFLNLVLPVDIRGGFSLLPEQVEALEPGAQSAECPAGTGNAETVFLYTGDAEGTFLPYRTEVLQLESERVVLRLPAEQRAFRPFVRTVRNRLPDLTVLWRGLPDILRGIWLPGFFMILLYNLACAAGTQRMLSRDRWESWDEKNRIAEVKGLPAPFLWGIFRPVIFLPAGLEEEERRCIIAHESCHRRRMDFVTKPVFFGAVCLHWFNPLVWLAWALFCRDLEICCDETVFAVSGGISRKQYARSLLKYAAAQNGYRVFSLTFGEPSAGVRIRHILRFRKKNVALQSAAGLAAALIILGLVVRPVNAGSMQEPKPSADTAAGSVREAGEAVLTEKAAVLADSEGGDFLTGTGDAVSELTWEPEHRMGYQRPEVIHVVREEASSFTPDLRPEGELEMLARTALRDLYDLTGYQVEHCVYECTDLGTFLFAGTPKDLKHSRTFYTRTFGAAQGYDPQVIPSMDFANAGRVWFSDIQQLDLPGDAEKMSSGELAVWFLGNSAVYQGEKIDHTEQLAEPESERVYTAEGTFYEIALEDGFIGVSSIYGPYPEASVH